LVAARRRGDRIAAGGCAIGNRPIDLHLKALEGPGARRSSSPPATSRATAPKGGLIGGTISFPQVSVGATENALMAAVLAKGTTLIENAAASRNHRSRQMPDRDGRRKSRGLRTDTLTIHGKDRLHGATYAVMPDRIEAGSYACAALITGGSLELAGAREDSMHAILSGLTDAGAHLDLTRTGHHRQIQRRDQAAVDLDRALPGLPHRHAGAVHGDAGPGRGHQPVDRDHLENRYMHVPELSRMGADIEVRGRSAVVRGVKG
jgi:UDP-N-acetylglucosamine 1-carboxyvinyltransferase